MKTTALSKCLIRNRLVKLTPEERVRQMLIEKMVKTLGYPKGLISIEKGIGSRRYDLLCYTRGTVPLLLIECKATELNDDVLRQAVGYNGELRAPFICLASPSEIKTFWREGGKMREIPFLPMYEELCRQIS